MTKCTFVMMVGLPGSGKSTYAKKIQDEYDAQIISSLASRSPFKLAPMSL